MIESDGSEKTKENEGSPEGDGKEDFYSVHCVNTLLRAALTNLAGVVYRCQHNYFFINRKKERTDRDPDDTLKSREAPPALKLTFEVDRVSKQCLATCQSGG